MTTDRNLNPREQESFFLRGLDLEGGVQILFRVQILSDFNV